MLNPEFLVGDETDNPLFELNNCNIFWINKYINAEGVVYYEFNNPNTEASEAPLQLTEDSFKRLIAQLQKMLTEEPEEEDD